MGSSSDSECGRPPATAAARAPNLLSELRVLYGLHGAREVRPSSPVEVTFEVDGQSHPGTLIELSEQGAKLASDNKPQVGSMLKVGRITARVVGHASDGIVIEFVGISD
jgi:hypothetical protein